MNILIITSLYPNEKKKNLPSTTKAVHNLVKYWTKENRVVCMKVFRHTVTHPMRMLNKSFVSNVVKNDDFELTDGVEIYALEYCMLPLQKVMGQGLVNYISGRINKKMSDIQFLPDLIISHMPLVDGVEQYVHKVNGACPRIAVLHRSDVDFLDHKFLKKALETNFDRVFSRSTSIYRMAYQKGLSNLKEKIVSSGINAEIEVPTRRWEEFHRREIKLLYAGTLIKRKAVDCIIEAVDRLPADIRVSLCIIGEGGERKKLEKLVHKKQLQDKVSFLGKQSREFVYEQMAQSDIFVMISRRETLGLVYLEAMSMGCITIGSRNEGIDGIIEDHKNGYLTEAFHVEELENCIKQIANETTENLKRISVNGMKTARYYNEEDAAKRYLEMVLN